MSSFNCMKTVQLFSFYYSTLDVFNIFFKTRETIFQNAGGCQNDQYRQSAALSPHRQQTSQIIIFRYHPDVSPPYKSSFPVLEPKTVVAFVSHNISTFIKRYCLLLYLPQACPQVMPQASPLFSHMSFIIVCPVLFRCYPGVDTTCVIAVFLVRTKRTGCVPLPWSREKIVFYQHRQKAAGFLPLL